jgi:hypothetical protein
MKKSIRLLTLLMVLAVSFYTNSASSQQPADDLAKLILPVKIANYPSPGDDHNTVVKETASGIHRDSSLNLIDNRYSRLQQQAASIKEYAKANHFNTEYCFLVDMSIPSGKKRFFVYNMKSDSLEYSSLVAHGWGSSKSGNDQLAFSNIPNSCQTSLGKYKIGHSYNGTFGLAYKLYGLDNTNSNAFERAIVLHSLSHVPDSETYPENICNSAGCPMVSPSFLAILGKYIKASQKPILLWIYN